MFDKIESQIEELRVHFDDEHIYNECSTDKLTPEDYTLLKIKIKSKTKDGIYPISGKVSLQLKEGKVFIIDFNPNK